MSDPVVQKAMNSLLDVKDLAEENKKLKQDLEEMTKQRNYWRKRYWEYNDQVKSNEMS